MWVFTSGILLWAAVREEVETTNAISGRCLASAPESFIKRVLLVVEKMRNSNNVMQPSRIIRAPFCCMPFGMFTLWPYSGENDPFSILTTNVSE